MFLKAEKAAGVGPHTALMLRAAGEVHVRICSARCAYPACVPPPQSTTRPMPS
jgi:hypothetical protein